MYFCRDRVQRSLCGDDGSGKTRARRQRILRRTSSRASRSRNSRKRQERNSKRELFLSDVTRCATLYIILREVLLSEPRRLYVRFFFFFLSLSLNINISYIIIIIKREGLNPLPPPPTRPPTVIIRCYRRGYPPRRTGFLAAGERRKRPGVRKHD